MGDFSRGAVMNSKHGRSFVELFSTSFTFLAKNSKVKPAENFNLVFPANFADCLDLQDFLLLLTEHDREAFAEFLYQGQQGKILFTTIKQNDSEGKTGPFCSACSRIDSAANDKIVVSMVNISGFMPGPILYRDLQTLVNGLSNVRKITHDLNNQFQIITGYGSTLQDELSDPDQKESASSIVNAVTQAVSNNMQLRKLFPPKNPPQLYIHEEMQHEHRVAGTSESTKKDADSIISKPSAESPNLASIMVVDDEPLVKKFLCDMLKRLNFKPCGFENGITAAKAIKELQKFDLAILDMNLPDISTEELFEILKESAPETKIILISGETQNDACNRMLDKGAEAYLQKPTSVQLLSETINKIIGAR